MTDQTWTLTSADGRLVVTTGVAGPAAKMGHRLTIEMAWTAEVSWDDGPVSAQLTVDVGSLQVLRGDGGVKGLSDPEKAVARTNALKSFEADRFPTIVFRSANIDRTDGGYRLTGSLQIHGRTRDCTVELDVEDAGDRWHLATGTQLRQSDFEMAPYSLMFGALRVADEVAVSFDATAAKR